MQSYLFTMNKFVRISQLDIESAFFRLFRHRVLLEFRLIWTLYLNLNLDIESTVDLECSTRVRPPLNDNIATTLSVTVIKQPLVPFQQCYPYGALFPAS
eukprot:sb/3478632/